MALLFCDSQDHYTSGDIAKKYTHVGIQWNGNAGSYVTAGGSAPVIALNSSSGTLPPMNGHVMRGSSNSGYAGVSKAIGTPGTAIIGGWFYFGANPTNWFSGQQNAPLLGFVDTATPQLHLWGSGDGRLTLGRGLNSSVATSTNFLTLGAWTHLELKVTFHGTTGSYDVRVNGVSWLSATNVPTISSANTYATHAIWGFTYSGSVDLKSNYVLDTTGSVANDLLGPCRVAVLRPAAAGTYQQWTPNGGSNLGSVGELAFDGDTTFAQSGTANQVDSFTVNATPIASGTVYGVQVVLGAKQDTGAARTVAAFQRQASATPSDQPWTTQSLTTAYKFLTDAKSINPATGSPFTLAEVQGDEWGYKLIS